MVEAGQDEASGLGVAVQARQQLLRDQAAQLQRQAAAVGLHRQVGKGVRQQELRKSRLALRHALAAGQGGAAGLWWAGRWRVLEH